MEPSLDELKATIAENVSLVASHQQDKLPPHSLLRHEDLPKYIDHTLLKLEAQEPDIDRLCDEALRYAFKAVCVRLQWVSRCKYLLRDSGVAVACVIDFHEGSATPSVKSEDAGKAVLYGATELDLVIDYPALNRGEYSQVYSGISSVRKAANNTAAEIPDKPTIVLKTILETSQLSSEAIIAACTIAKLAGADFVKTSTGFNGPGATVENVRLMKQVVGVQVQVKASGGVKGVDDCMKMIEVGATRIGTSNGVKIMQEVEKLSTANEDSKQEIIPKDDY